MSAPPLTIELRPDDGPHTIRLNWEGTCGKRHWQNITGTAAAELGTNLLLAAALFGRSSTSGVVGGRIHDLGLRLEQLARAIEVNLPPALAGPHLEEHAAEELKAYDQGRNVYRYAGVCRCGHETRTYTARPGARAALCAHLLDPTDQEDTTE